jgi:hypothetical protein
MSRCIKIQSSNQFAICSILSPKSETGHQKWQAKEFQLLKYTRGRIATRYDKLAANYLAFLQLASIRLWLSIVESTPWTPLPLATTVVRAGLFPPEAKGRPVVHTDRPVPFEQELSITRHAASQ